MLNLGSRLMVFRHDADPAILSGGLGNGPRPGAWTAPAAAA